MTKAHTLAELEAQSLAYRGTGGSSEESASLGFQPAFLDEDTGAVYFSRFANGRLAPLHTLNGLPDDLVAERDEQGNVAVVKHCLISGFVMAGEFYSRDECVNLLDAAGF